MHYGHPDVFDRVFHITRGGISKASRVINISEDIYAGQIKRSLLTPCSLSLVILIKHVFWIVWIWSHLLGPWLIQAVKH